MASMRSVPALSRAGSGASSGYGSGTHLFLTGIRLDLAYAVESTSASCLISRALHSVAAVCNA